MTHVQLATANELPEFISNANKFRQKGETMHLVESFMWHYYQSCYCYLPQDKQHSVGGVKHTKQLSLIEAEKHTIKRLICFFFL